ncbi:hypothetical protein PHYBOEH_008636 [Phytophthora boehmeriae]|uniref:EF-hand domain-containing protein n=1 Tax=Phytophthora boehmeriae TaxID=109152 RepID=A0A8T1VYJ5_9STRA|nr:hypothetical protein PHYBOEH_008636 [Phytophthora boehmeriae]
MMMEGESSTPVAERVPDEETAFVKKVEAPKRRQSRMRAKKKRLAVAGVSVVALVALAGMCAFVALSSESPNETNVVESEVMATDPAKEQFVPSFDNYDTDGNGKVSLGEYLDGFAANWGAALEKVETAGLDGAKRSRIDQYLDEDFAEHSNCVVRFAQQVRGPQDIFII